MRVDTSAVGALLFSPLGDSSSALWLLWPVKQGVFHFWWMSCFSKSIWKAEDQAGGECVCARACRCASLFARNAVSDVKEAHIWKAQICPHMNVSLVHQGHVHTGNPIQDWWRLDFRKCEMQKKQQKKNIQSDFCRTEPRHMLSDWIRSNIYAC